MAWLRLLRLPALFTTFPDVLAGFAVVTQGEAGYEVLPYLLLASACLYLAGMVWNDYFDREQDLQERPQRPIPAGQISASQARNLALLLMCLGLGAAAGANLTSFVVAALLALAILAYDAGGKKTPVGPWLMGSCRALNFLLGASTLGVENLQTLLPCLLAGLIGLYVAGITYFARREAVDSSRSQLYAGVSCLVLAIIGWGMLASWKSETDELRLVMILLSLMIFQISRRLIPALKTGEPRHVQQGVRILLLTIPMLEALVIVAHGGNSIPLAIAAALMMLPGLILSRFIPMT